jgi:hypothetical protein
MNASFTRYSVALATFLLVCLHSNSADAQGREPLIGLGFTTVLSSDDGLGFGFRSRISAPVRADLSFALDLGAAAFILEGRDTATYIFDPQVSAIITFPGTSRATYLLGGVGGYIPFSDQGRSEGGPTLHFGIGWAKPLSETLLYYEFDPALIIKKSSVSVAFPFRIGIIL